MTTKTHLCLSSINNSKLNSHLNVPLAFASIDQVMKTFNEPDFIKLEWRKKFHKINQTLCQLVQDSSHHFLFKAVIHFLEKVNQEKIFHEPLDFAAFEFWLNHFSGLSEAENYQIRAKIVGKFIPRGEYQAFFPVGMNKTHAGTHFVAAHLSPDVDTMIASFWGWLDAFGARVGTGLHRWCLPGGPPDSPVTSIFKDLFGTGVFTQVAYTNSSLNLTARDLITQKQVKKELGNTLVNSIDQVANDQAVILVNEQGHYLGDWHNSDVEPVRQVVGLFKSCLHWFERHLHTHLIALFAKKELSAKDLSNFNLSIFDIKFSECESVKDFNSFQWTLLNDFFNKVLNIEKGLEGTFRELNQALNALSVSQLSDFEKELESLISSPIFDEKGKLNENRPQIFDYLKKLIEQLDKAILSVRNYVERLDVMLSIKYKVLNISHVYLTLRSDVEEIRQKMQNNHFLTVIIHEKEGSLFPVGIVQAKDLRESRLGTVTLRDFCNLDEIKMSSYLEVISVVDHHKASLRTFSVPTAIIGDAQSCNVLIAEQSFLINDKYSLGGMSLQQIEEQIAAISLPNATLSQMRILQRLLKRKIVAHQKSNFYVHPEREFNEYLSFLHAILDDTDLLTKVSHRDLECVVQLLNRLKSLTLGQEVEIIHFDEMTQDKNFIKSATKHILQQADMYSIYKQIYDSRESETEMHLGNCVDRKKSSIFLDTKEQNGCTRVGQTKMFASNFPFFLKNNSKIQQYWLEKSQEVYKEKPEIDLYLHMMSTIASAEEMYKNQVGPYHHQDELWIWVPATQQSYNHLNSFLAGFQNAAKDFKESFLIEFLGPSDLELVDLFNQHFPGIPQSLKESSSLSAMVVLHFRAGALNSRKSMITPYLPRLT